MTEGQIILGWWSRNIGDRNSPAARGLAARLRRAGQVEVLGEGPVHELARDWGLKDAALLVRLVQVLAEVRGHTGPRLAQRLGFGDPPKLSTLRFQRLMRAGDELLDALRRALVMAERGCNVAALGSDLLHWNEATRSRWCFDYFGAEAPAALLADDDLNREIPA